MAVATTSFHLEPVADSRHALRLTISNPPINLVNSNFLNELHALLLSYEDGGGELDPHSHPKVIIVSSENADIWLSHLDLHIISAQYPLKASEGDPGKLLHLLGDILRLLRALPILFIAEVNGLAVGGGDEFAVNMDMRFAGPNARFGVPEVAGGVVHGGGIQQLTKIIGPGRALEFMASARALDGREASRIGLANKHFDTEAELRTYVNTLATRIASFPRGGIEATKSGVQECLDGVGSIEKDMQRLGQLAHSNEAQRLISKLIEAGEDQEASAFELGLPDSAGEQLAQRVEL